MKEDELSQSNNSWQQIEIDLKKPYLFCVANEL